MNLYEFLHSLHFQSRMKIQLSKLALYVVFKAAVDIVTLARNQNFDLPLETYTIDIKYS